MKTKQNSNRFDHQWQLERTTERASDEAKRMLYAFLSPIVYARISTTIPSSSIHDHNTIHFLDPAAVGGEQDV